MTPAMDEAMRRARAMAMVRATTMAKGWPGL